MVKVNRTNIQFSHSEIQLIEKGYKLIIQRVNNNNDCELLGMNCELVSNNLLRSRDNSTKETKSDKHF